MTPPAPSPEEPLEQVVGFLRSAARAPQEIERFLTVTPSAAPARAPGARVWSWRLDPGAPPTPDTSVTRFRIVEKARHLRVGEASHPLLLRGVMVLDTATDLWVTVGDDYGESDAELV